MEEYLYEYSVFDVEADKEVVRYESNAVPPAVGSLLDLAMVMDKGFPTTYQVFAIRAQPLSLKHAISQKTKVELIVRAVESEDAFHPLNK